MQRFNYLLKIEDDLLDKIVEDIEARQDLWDMFPIRGESNPDNPTDILLYFKIPDSKNDLETVSFPAAYLLQSSRFFMFNLFHAVKGERLGRVIISRAQGGTEVEIPAQDNAYENYYNHYVMVLKTNPQVTFESENETFKPNAGDVFWYSGNAARTIRNKGRSDLWVFTIDIKKPYLYDSVKHPWVKLAPPKPLTKKQEVIAQGNVIDAAFEEVPNDKN